MSIATFWVKVNFSENGFTFMSWCPELKCRSEFVYFKVKLREYFVNCFVFANLLSVWLTFSGLAKVAIFTTNVDAENQCLINHKCVCGALNRHFCQTRVTCWPSVCRVAVCLVNIEFMCHCMLCLSGCVLMYFYFF
jgi:hypothetical protein